MMNFVIYTAHLTMSGSQIEELMIDCRCSSDGENNKC
jgi:hypothetical protein